MKQRNHLSTGQVRVHAFAPGIPPAEIKLWSKGDNSTDYGIHRWTQRSIDEVYGEYQRRGNPLQIDVEHTNSEAPKSAAEVGPTGGYARLEIREAEPWLVFDWSAYAVEQISTRQRLFLSPEYDVDTTTGEITRLVRVSLVADPGTHNARMLASAPRCRAGRKPMLDPMVRAALNAALKAADPRKALEDLLKEIDSMPADEAPASEAPAQAAAEPPAEEQKDMPTQAAVPDAPADEDKKDQVARKAAAAPSEDEKQLARRVAELETDKVNREAEARYQAASARIPESLRVYARKISTNPAEFEEFVKALPAQKGVGGVKASTGRTQAETGNTRAGRMSEEDDKTMKRVFASNAAPESPFELLPNGGIRATHMYRPKPGFNHTTLVPSNGIKEA